MLGNVGSEDGRGEQRGSGVSLPSLHEDRDSVLLYLLESSRASRGLAQSSYPMCDCWLVMGVNLYYWGLGSRETSALLGPGLVSRSVQSETLWIKDRKPALLRKCTEGGEDDQVAKAHSASSNKGDIPLAKTPPCHRRWLATFTLQGLEESTGLRMSGKNGTAEEAFDIGQARRGTDGPWSPESHVWSPQAPVLRPPPYA